MSGAAPLRAGTAEQAPWNPVRVEYLDAAAKLRALGDDLRLRDYPVGNALTSPGFDAADLSVVAGLLETGEDRIARLPEPTGSHVAALKDKSGALRVRTLFDVVQVLEEERGRRATQAQAWNAVHGTAVANDYRRKNTASPWSPAPALEGGTPARIARGTVSIVDAEPYLYLIDGEGCFVPNTLREKNGATSWGSADERFFSDGRQLYRVAANGALSRDPIRISGTPISTARALGDGAWDGAANVVDPRTWVHLVQACLTINAEALLVVKDAFGALLDGDLGNELLRVTHADVWTIKDRLTQDAELVAHVVTALAKAIPPQVLAYHGTKLVTELVAFEVLARGVRAARLPQRFARIPPSIRAFVTRAICNYEKKHGLLRDTPSSRHGVGTSNLEAPGPVVAHSSGTHGSQPPSRPEPSTSKAPPAGQTPVPPPSPVVVHHLGDARVVQKIDSAKLVVFDLNGTLIDDELLQLASTNAVLEPYGLTLTAEHWAQHGVGHSEEAIFSALRASHPNKLPAVSELVEARNAIHLRLASQQAQSSVRPEILELLRAAKAAGKKVALATSAPKAEVEAVLGPNGLNMLDEFDVVATAESVASGKPSPDLFLHVAKELRVAPTDVIVLEDSSMGVAAARAAGMPCIATPNRFTANHDFSLATIIFRRP